MIGALLVGMAIAPTDEVPMLTAQMGAGWLAALVLLWMFHRTAGPVTETLDQVIVLGFPASVGAAAGRLAV